MPSKDTLIHHLTKKTRNELERIRKIISKEIGIPLEKVTLKHAEITLRLKANNGSIKVKDLRDIILGKIK